MIVFQWREDNDAMAIAEGPLDAAGSIAFVVTLVRTHEANHRRKNTGHRACYLVGDDCCFLGPDF